MTPYRTIIADPPWPSGKPKSEKRSDWMQTNMKPRYGTMKRGDLLTFLRDEKIEIADSACLLLWSTWMHLSLAMEVAQAWGFTYKTGMPWIKTTKDGHDLIYGPGIWFQHCTEIVLVCTRGKFSNPRPARKGSIVSPRLGHSTKPEELHEWAETRLPGPHLELFARRKRKGWKCLGLEVGTS